MAAEPLLVAPGPMVPQPYVVRSRARETADTWTLELVPFAGRADRPGAGPVRDAHRLRRRRGADLPQRTRRRRLARAHDPRRRCGHGRALPHAARRNDRRARAVRDDLAARGRDRGADVVVARGRARARPAPARGRGACWPSATRTAACLCSTAPALPATCSIREQLEDWREDGLDVHLTVDAGTRSWLDRVGFVSDPSGRRHVRPRVGGRARLRARGDDAGHASPRSSSAA